MFFNFKFCFLVFCFNVNFILKTNFHGDNGYMDNLMIFVIFNKTNITYSNV